jgi:methylmalonyl-CoA mutase
MDKVVEKTGAALHSKFLISDEMSEKIFIIPPSRNRYLSEISETIRKYNKWADEQSDIAQKLYQLDGTKSILDASQI